MTCAPGSTVVIRDEEWLVTAVSQTGDSTMVTVRGLSELVRGTEAVFSTALDRIAESDPRLTDVVADDSPRNRKSRLWLEAMLRKTPVPIADPSLTVSAGGLADPLEYQRAATRQALDPTNLRPRILLADAVGLGKTLEIGMILSELVRRGRGERILIITPQHILEQTQFEMWTRFALPFVRLDSVGIARVRQKLPSNRNPFTYFKRVIISIDTLKSERYQPHLRNHRWDAVVIDESHNVTNVGTQNNTLARIVSASTDALILASATPHNGKADSFAELVRMLDPLAVAPDGTLDEDRLKCLIVRRHRHSPDVASVVGGDWAVRKPPTHIAVVPSEVEEAIARELEDTWLHPEGANPYSGKASTLFPWTLAKAFLSSPAALLESIHNRLRSLDHGTESVALTSGEDVDAESVEAAPDDDELDLSDTPATPHTQSATTERKALHRLRLLTEQSLEEPSAKYRELLALLKREGVAPGSSERVVVFAERVATLTWLRTKIAQDLRMPDEAVVVLHGGLSDRDQQDVVESFKQAASPIRVLVTGDVASEGVNLHSQCHRLVHFDIPWSLIRIEQRNGRIDRYGQKKPPQITTLLLDPRTTRQFAGDLRVLTRLMEREHEAHEALGDTASLMGKYSVRAEEKAIVEVLRRARDEDTVIAAVTDIATRPGLVGLFARLGQTTAARTSFVVPVRSVDSGLFGSDVEFLDEALRLAFATPGKAPPNGVAWTPNLALNLVSLVPPRDLAARLVVLPETYLRDRRVMERLILATNIAKGNGELTQARQVGATAWPEGHYLAPLHPVLDWAADRALAELGRSQVFAVRGKVDTPTVLVQGTVTNRRGHVIGTQYATVTCIGSATLPEPHADAREAIASLGLVQANIGSVDNPGQYRSLIAPAIDAFSESMRLQIGAIHEEAAARVALWRDRADAWQRLADTRASSASLKNRRHAVVSEQEIVDDMEPDRTLIRPLLVVVPQGGNHGTD